MTPPCSASGPSEDAAARLAKSSPRLARASRPSASLTRSTAQAMNLQAHAPGSARAHTASARWAPPPAPARVPAAPAAEAGVRPASARRTPGCGAGRAGRHRLPHPKSRCWNRRRAGAGGPCGSRRAGTCDSYPRTRPIFRFPCAAGPRRSCCAPRWLGGLVHLRVIHADAHAVGLVALHAFHDETLQHLVLQRLAVRHLDAARLQVAGDAQRRFMQFAQRDHVLVDDGGNAIDELLGLRGRRAFARRRACRRPCQRTPPHEQPASRRKGPTTRRCRTGGARVQPTHHSYLSNVVPFGTGGVMRL